MLSQNCKEFPQRAGGGCTRDYGDAKWSMTSTGTMFTTKFFTIFFGGKNKLWASKPAHFYFFGFVPLFSICRIFRSLTFDSVTKWLEHRKLIIKTATTQKLNFSPALSGVRLHTVSFGIFQKHGLSIRSYWLHCSVFVRAGQRGGN